MADAILVLNAGSSRLRFSVFLDGEQPQPLLSGQIEELLTHPRFEVRDASLNVVDRREWEAGTDLGHQGAIEYLLARRGGALAGHRMVAASHRVVHGGVKFTGPVLVHTDTLTELEKLVPLAPCSNRTIWQRSGRWHSVRRSFPRWPVSIHRSIELSHGLQRSSGYRAIIWNRA